MGAETKDNHEQDSRVRWVLRQVGSTRSASWKAIGTAWRVDRPHSRVGENSQSPSSIANIVAHHESNFSKLLWSRVHSRPAANALGCPPTDLAWRAVVINPLYQVEACFKHVSPEKFRLFAQSPDTVRQRRVQSTTPS